MKKIYAYILLTTMITLSTRCMELQPELVDVDLTPVIKPLRGTSTEYLDCRTNTIKTITQEKQKPTICTNNLTRCDIENLRNTLYNAARDYVYSLKDDFDLSQHERLIGTIILMREAKNKSHRITPDVMSTIAYETNQHNWNKNDIPLFFNCLKQYMLTTDKTKEGLPLTIDTHYYNTKLTQTLNNSTNSQNMKLLNDILQYYPAYMALIHNTKTLRSHITLLNDCLYSDTKILFIDYPRYIDVTDFNSFYYYARDLLHTIHTSYYTNTYNFLTLIEHIQSKENISDEKDMLNKIVNFDPTQQTDDADDIGYYLHKAKGMVLNIINQGNDTIAIKNRIAMSYIFTEKFERSRGNKKRPTSKQYKAYLRQKELDIALPDNFDATIFDEKMYAFNEFEQCVDNIRIVSNASDKAIQQCIKDYTKILSAKIKKGLT